MHKLNTTFFIYSIFYFNNYAFQMNPYPNWLVCLNQLVV